MQTQMWLTGLTHSTLIRYNHWGGRVGKEEHWGKESRETKKDLMRYSIMLHWSGFLMLSYFFIYWQVFDVVLLFFLLPLHPLWFSPLCKSIRFSSCSLVFFNFCLQHFHLILLSFSFYSLWSRLLVDLGLFPPFFVFNETTRENSIGSWYCRNQPLSPAHRDFHAPAFHRRINLPKDTRAGPARACVCGN